MTTDNIQAKNYLIALLQSVHEEATLSPQLSKALRTVLDHVKADPLVLWRNPNCDLLAHALLMVLVHEISEEEDDLLLAAHLSYFYYYHRLSQETTEEKFFEVHRKILILVSHFSDYLRHTIAMSYRGKAQNPTQEEFIKSLSIANHRIHFLQIFALDTVEQRFKDYADDPYLIQCENELAAAVQFTPENLEEGELLHKVLMGYIAKKIQLGDLKF